MYIKYKNSLVNYWCMVTFSTCCHAGTKLFPWGVEIECIKATIRIRRRVLSFHNLARGSTAQFHIHVSRKGKFAILDIGEDDFNAFGIIFLLFSSIICRFSIIMLRPWLLIRPASILASMQIQTLFRDHTTPLPRSLYVYIQYPIHVQCGVALYTRQQMQNEPGDMAVERRKKDRIIPATPNACGSSVQGWNFLADPLYWYSHQK